MCTRMVVSDRAPVTNSDPLPWYWASPGAARLSEPTSRKFWAASGAGAGRPPCRVWKTSLRVICPVKCLNRNQPTPAVSSTGAGVEPTTSSRHQAVAPASGGGTHPITTGRLGAVQGDVSRGEQVGEVGAVPVENGHSDGDGHAHGAAGIELEDCHCHIPAQPLGDLGRLDAVGVRQYDGELLPAESAQEVVRTQAGL